MKTLSVRERQELIILSAIERKPLAESDLQEKLGDAGFVFDAADIRAMTEEMCSDSIVTLWGVPSPTVTPGCESPMRAVQITKSGVVRLADLRETAGRDSASTPTFAASAGRYCGTLTIGEAPETPIDDEPRVMFCLTGVALDGWWNSLTVEQKADVMVSHYEMASLGDVLVPDLTAAGKGLPGKDAER